eukprot:TRINITY_DN2365_c0_g1_i1.p1 TRINITY_DN2365_c0_g1~~TRINITY_DN2365_c0_g1_i1.p1  ORF type:complete len:153 (-),score=31.79 TRINITY_DN2365_c0_g1_i1:89-511(-)
MANVDDPEIFEAYNRVRSNNDDTDWLILDYTNNTTLKVGATGSGGAEELSSHFKNNAVQYGYVKITYSKASEGDAGGKRTKFAFIAWGGPSASVLQKAKMSVHKASVKEIIKDFALEIQTSDPEDIRPDAIRHAIEKVNY